MIGNKVNDGWIQLPDVFAKIYQIKYISDRGTIALFGNRYSRGFILEGKAGRSWQNLFRVLRNEKIECTLILGELGETAVLQIEYHSLKKKKDIDKEFEKNTEELNALLSIMDIKILPMDLEERLGWLLQILGIDEVDKNNIWNNLENSNMKAFFQMSEEEKVMKTYFLRRGKEVSSKFLNEIRSLSSDAKILLHMEPISDESVHKNMKRLYGVYGEAKEEQNNYTNMSLMLYLRESFENMAYIEKDMKAICMHYGQELIALEEDSWGNLAFISGTSSRVYNYVRCYQTKTIEKLLSCI